MLQRKQLLLSCNSIQVFFCLELSFCFKLYCKKYTIYLEFWFNYVFWGDYFKEILLKLSQKVLISSLYQLYQSLPVCLSRRHWDRVTLRLNSSLLHALLTFFSFLTSIWDNWLIISFSPLVPGCISIKYCNLHVHHVLIVKKVFYSTSQSQASNRTTWCCDKVGFSGCQSRHFHGIP